MSTPFTTAAELAEIYRVTPKTILIWHREGTIPSEVHVGQTIRFDAAKVAAALKRRTRDKSIKPVKIKGVMMVPVI